VQAEFAFEMESPDGLAVLFNTEEKSSVWTSECVCMRRDVPDLGLAEGDVFSSAVGLTLAFQDTWAFDTTSCRENLLC
jgi:hypothetical protein